MEENISIRGTIKHVKVNVIKIRFTLKGWSPNIKLVHWNNDRVVGVKKNWRVESTKGYLLAIGGNL